MKKSQPTSNKTSTKKITSNQQPPGQKQPQAQPQPKPSTAKQQNMKEFKVQIDHEIAKCLDTLNRQGLKYLKETLKNSNVFNEEIKEAINAEKSREKRKVSKSPTKNKKHDQIQEQIVEEYETFMEDQQEPSKEKTKLGPNPTYPLKQQKSIPLKLEKFQDKIQQPLKPFALRSGSRQASRPILQETKAVDKRIIQKQHHEQEMIDKNEIDEIVQKISHLPEQKLKKVSRFIQILQKSQKLEQQQLLNLKQTRPYLFKPEEQAELSNPSNMMKSSAVNKGKKNEKATSLYNSIMKGSKVNNRIPEKQQNNAHYSEHADQTFLNDNQITEQIPDVEQENKANHPKSMDIPDQMIKPDYEYVVRHEQKNASQQKKAEDKNNESIGKKNDSTLIKKGSFIKNFPISNIKKPLDIQVTESHQADTFQINQGLNQSKMVRLGKKKLGTNKVKVVLLRNRGHPSIIGLTGIELYNTSGKLIPILLENIKSQSPKLLRLFNGIHQTVNEEQMFTTVFKRDYEIELQIPEKIGGMKIWNYNKSQIQSSKQTDWIQLYINDRLSWEGFIKKGSYNELIDYCTEAIVEPGFDFALIKKQSVNDKIDQLSQAPSSNENIKIQGGGASGLSLGKRGQRDSKKVDWLEKTIMQENIKKIIEQDKQKQEIQARKTIFKPTRFSQIYQQQEKPTSKPTESKQKFHTVSSNKKQQSLTKNTHIDSIKQLNPQKQAVNPIQRTSRSTSQKIEEQKDIFSIFGQSLIKQKMKANQINNKVNQITQKIDKLKETYRKDDFGYSSLITKQEPVQHKSIPKIQIKETKDKKSYQKQSLDDFMNDSLFQEPVPKNQKKAKQVQPFNAQKVQNQTTLEKNFNKKFQPQQKPKNDNKVDIDDFLNQLNDLVGAKENKHRFGNSKQKNITIPELPKGNKLQIILVSNWGDQQSIGVNKIQFFDHQGSRVFPSEAKSSGSTNSVTCIFSQNKGYITQLTSQWKSNKKQEIKLQLSFSKKIQLSLVRIWNYIGDRVHAMIGVRKIQIILDGNLIFVGDIRKNGGTSRDEIFKSCQKILFTNNIQIQKRIIENDWLTQQLINQRQQTVIFKKTIQNFMRPQTNCIMNQKQLKMIQNKEGFKLPKRNCFEYDPPLLPSGHYLKLILHTTWGDRDFIGLNSIIVYDQKGQQITDIKKISQFPAPLITLAGYEKDKRVLTNLFDGKNLTSSDESIWLAPFLQDIDKMQKQAQNAILIEFDKCCTFSAINFYNYVKTPKRGVREIQIYVDNFLIYRGYLRMANIETGQILTTINFTKDASLLEKIGYIGYNEDNLGQEVIFYNEGKIQKAMF